jgi:hypothetical protein
MEKQINCTCTAWSEQFPQIEKAVKFARVYGYAVTLEPFLFCPWCQKELKAPVIVPVPAPAPTKVIKPPVAKPVAKKATPKPATKKQATKKK